MEGDPKPEQDEYALPNDPIYLMRQTSTPHPFKDEAMFGKYGEEWEVRPTIEFNGERHEVAIRFTVASEEAREPSRFGPSGGHPPSRDSRAEEHWNIHRARQKGTGVGPELGSPF